MVECLQKQYNLFIYCFFLEPIELDISFPFLSRHSLLFSYGSPEDGADFSADDADANLVPGLVEREIGRAHV